MNTTDKKDNVVHTPLFQSYSETRMLMGALSGVVKKAEFLLFLNAIWDQTGTPQNPVDWSKPDEWIPERLTGSSRTLALRIWEQTKKLLNPRHVYGAYLFINRYGLLKADAAGVFQETEAGKLFMADDPATVRKLDEAEGLPKLLAILATHSPAKRGDLLEEWGEFLLAHSKFGTTSTIKDTLRRRILNLVERGFISREGNTYTITDKGIAYAANGASIKAVSAHQQVLAAIKQHNDSEVVEFRERLGKMNPYHFEMLIRDLLEAMDYEDVIVTKQSGDKGVDVVGYFQFGITQVKEVVQVKRHQGSITRPVLDQLRGALPYHQAIRGTIITLGKFAQGCKDAAIFPGAAPITLIDGDKLLELFVKHEVGVKRSPVPLFKIDESIFEQSGPETEPGLGLPMEAETNNA
ncbi:restriction endonuclease [Polaromonas sp. UC242_47]|uniref:restriction endonuclease n=1 Tax=Polaromonas sp. UC242_47 TaxID=3374626 RepID=UPI0037ADC871